MTKVKNATIVASENVVANVETTTLVIDKVELKLNNSTLLLFTNKEYASRNFRKRKNYDRKTITEKQKFLSGFSKLERDAKILELFKQGIFSPSYITSRQKNGKTLSEVISDLRNAIDERVIDLHRQLSIEIKNNGNVEKTDLYAVSVGKIVYVKGCENLKAGSFINILPFNESDLKTDKIQKIVLKKHLNQLRFKTDVKDSDKTTYIVVSQRVTGEVKKVFLCEYKNGSYSMTETQVFSERARNINKAFVCGFLNGFSK